MFIDSSHPDSWSLPPFSLSLSLSVHSYFGSATSLPPTSFIIGSLQCDHMAELFLNIWLSTTMKTRPIA